MSSPRILVSTFAFSIEYILNLTSKFQALIIQFVSLQEILSYSTEHSKHSNLANSW